MERHRRVQQQRPSWKDEILEDDRYYDMEPVEPKPRQDKAEEILSTEAVVKLICTLAAMMPLFSLFLIFAEKKSRAIRHYALQSVGLTVCHMVVGGVLLAVNAVFGGIPYLGFLMNLVLWIVYIAAAIVMLVVRIRMMFVAWQGGRFTLPVIGNMLERYNQ